MPLLDAQRKGLDDRSSQSRLVQTVFHAGGQELFERKMTVLYDNCKKLITADYFTDFACRRFSLDRNPRDKRGFTVCHFIRVVGHRKKKSEN